MNTYTVTPVSVAEIRVGDSLLVEGRPRTVGRVVEVDVPVKSLLNFLSRRRTRAVAVAATTLIAALDDADAPGEPDTDTEDTEATDEDEEADDEEA